MDIRVLDTNFNVLTIMDQYESFIWTDRYREYGDFELYLLAHDDLFNYIKQDYYLQISDSEHMMIIEQIKIESDAEDGNHVTISGRSLESILDRRIVWKQQTVSGTLQDGIKALLDDSIINPSVAERKIDNFIFEPSTDTAVTGVTREAQYTGDNLYDVVKEVCEAYGIGFKITLNDSNQFVFKFYSGTDRSYEQTANPYIVFSPNFENILNSNYIEANSALKNVTLIGGEGEGSDRKYATFGSASGLSRRELFTDARDISSTVDSEDTMTDAEYTAKLQERGREKLYENVVTTSFEGEAETTTMFKYGQDFFIGDIVQVADEYGHELAARIIELVISEDTDGYSVYPTFQTITDEEEE